MGQIGEDGVILCSTSDICASVLENEFRVFKYFISVYVHALEEGGPFLITSL